ncbi:hypothetical protein C0991_003928 [Blastosporella zonata]|nr:hypothetical protein C0991_003928 [Blastosporella zonata]
MPTHNVDPLPVLLDRPLQPKFCASCHSAVDQSSPSADGPVCPACRDRIQANFSTRLDSRTHCTPHQLAYLLRQIPKPPPFDDEQMLVDPPPPTSRSFNFPLYTDPPYTNPKKLTSLSIPCNTIDSVDTPPHHDSHVQSQSTTTHLSRRQQVPQYPSPLIDITRLRVKSNGSDCLYPGAIFRGIQKSGRNNYEVDVTIVDVNFSSSYLCGYLRIRGLTDDHPDLTTYFDAEIIGTRYGFLTGNWGATEQEDLVHWARFPAFHDIKDELKRPHMKLADRDRSIVFMRWKERFLVPNHRVSEINGASFAGFYYICVDFNPPPPRRASNARSTTQQLPITPENVEMSSPDSIPKSEAPRQPRSNSIESTAQRAAERVPSLASRSPPAAKMTGFYYHRNSEPLAGISTAIQLKKQLGFENFTIYEKATAVGGTWRDNTYPGCGSDVPGHWYSLSTELNPNWSSYYVKQPEIRAYWEELFSKYELLSHTQLGHNVLSANWDSEHQLYHVTVEDVATGRKTETEAEIIFLAIGGFMDPLYPKDIGGVEKFRGVAWHSARWRHDVDLKHKRVGVIGNGCSA